MEVVRRRELLQVTSGCNHLWVSRIDDCLVGDGTIINSVLVQ
jgi:hypothetical protein